ncbi:MAG: VanZ family protein [Chloroflexi bacterium]|nr:VanZ family protein [Chloroflexota bacterium]
MTIANVPWFWPGILVSAVAALHLAGLVSRAFGVRPAVAGALIFTLGVILSATLTPLRDAVEFGLLGTGTCDLSRFGLAPLSEISHVNDTSLNILLFIPLGIVTAFLPPGKMVVVGLLPLAIEAIQLFAPALARGCQSADVVDNATGLVLGLCCGLVGRRFHRSA